MRSAPSVSYPVGRSVFYGVLLLALGLLPLLALVLWWWHGGRAELLRQAAWPVAALGWVLWSAVAGWVWSRSATGQLRWQGMPSKEGRELGLTGWAWRPQPGAVDLMPLARPVVALDAQHWLLLRLAAQTGKTFWVCAERSRDPDRWLDLRRSLRFGRH